MNYDGVAVLVSRRGARRISSVLGDDDYIVLDHEHHHHDNGIDALSSRETGIVELIASGLDNRAIAEELCLSLKAVENYVGSIFRKWRLETGHGKHRRVAVALRYHGIN